MASCSSRGNGTRTAVTRHRPKKRANQGETILFFIVDLKPGKHEVRCPLSYRGQIEDTCMSNRGGLLTHIVVSAFQKKEPSLSPVSSVQESYCRACGARYYSTCLHETATANEVNTHHNMLLKAGVTINRMLMLKKGRVYSWDSRTAKWKT